MSIVPLKYGAQNYAWGKPRAQSKVAQLMGLSNAGDGSEDDNKKPFAEMWIGDHPKLPSTHKETGEKLVDIMKKNSDAWVSKQHASQFGASVPFLLKVLSIQTALSIQAHPHKELAKALHQRDPKNYPDDNHKPELVVALTPFEALCCFRTLEAIRAFAKELPALNKLVKNTKLLQQPDGSQQDSKTILRETLAHLYALPKEAVAASIDEHVHWISSQPQQDEHRVFQRTAQQYPGGDVGCWMIYFLNLFILQPGDALFLAPNEPHAYLLGDAVEIMASSDNVVRAGLTPKFKDVETLLDMLTYRTDSLKDARYAANTSAPQLYRPPSWCGEFQITRVPVGGGTDCAFSPGAHSFSIALVVEGKGAISVDGGATFADVAAGDAFALPLMAASGAGVQLRGEMAVFFAQTNGAATSASHI